MTLFFHIQGMALRSNPPIVNKMKYIRGGKTYIDCAPVREELQLHHKRTGVGPAALLSGERQGMPEGLNSALINNWLRGKADSLRADHYEWVISKWRTLADKDDAFVKLTPEIRERMKSEKQRTGVPETKLFERCPDVPHRLTPNLLRACLYIQAQKMMRKDHLDYVLSLWAAHPDFDKYFVDDKRKLKPGWLDYREIGGILEFHNKRTGIGPSALLRGKRHERPEGLTGRVLQACMRGTTKSMKKVSFDYVLSLWQSLPTKVKHFEI